MYWSLSLLYVVEHKFWEHGTIKYILFSYILHEEYHHEYRDAWRIPEFYSITFPRSAWIKRERRGGLKDVQLYCRLKNSIFFPKLCHFLRQRAKAVVLILCISFFDKRATLEYKFLYFAPPFLFSLSISIWELNHSPSFPMI
jgi:hypothetical protein